jgi:hypothetical protein
MEDEVIPQVTEKPLNVWFFDRDEMIVRNINDDSQIAVTGVTWSLPKSFGNGGPWALSLTVDNGMVMVPCNSGDASLRMMLPGDNTFTFANSA